MLSAPTPSCIICWRSAPQQKSLLVHRIVSDQIESGIRVVSRKKGKGIPVCRRSNRHLRAGQSSGAGTIVNDYRGPQCVSHPLCKDSREYVGASTKGKRHDQSDGLRGIISCMNVTAATGCHKSDSTQMSRNTVHIPLLDFVSAPGRQPVASAPIRAQAMMPSEVGFRLYFWLWYPFHFVSGLVSRPLLR